MLLTRSIYSFSQKENKIITNSYTTRRSQTTCQFQLWLFVWFEKSKIQNGDHRPSSPELNQCKRNQVRKKQIVTDIS